MTAVLGALALELKVQYRYGILAVAAALTGAWTAVLLALPREVAVGVAPVILLVDTVTFGALLVAGLLMWERAEGSRAALAVTPLTTGGHLCARILSLTLVSVLSAIPILLAATRGSLGALPPGLLGVALATVLFLAIPSAVAARSPELMRFLVVAPLPLVPLLLVPLLALVGLADHPALFVVPSTAAAELFRYATTPQAAVLAPQGLALAGGYLLACCVGMVVVALRQLDTEFAALPGSTVSDTDGHSVAPEPRRGQCRAEPSRVPRGGALAAFVRMDAAGVGRDLMLLVMVAAPLLLALALRLGYPPTTDYVHARFGVDLAPYQPLALVVLVLLHVPLMAGAVVALRLVEDRDDGTLLVLRVAPVSFARYLGYRLGQVTLATAGGLALAVPLSGLAAGHWDGALILATALGAVQAPLVVLAVTVVATNKVEALAVLKLGGVLLLLPALVWFLPQPWLLAWLPPFWVTQLALGTPDVPVWASLGAGGALTAACGALLARAATRTLTRH